jgi:lysyl-tRNA synthetase class 2
VAWRSGAEAGWVRTSPEIALKRAICAGAGSVFEVAAVARAGERGQHHLPEFHLLEWYRVGGELADLRRDVEAIVSGLGESLRSMFEREAPSLVEALPEPLAAPFVVLDFADAFQSTTGITLSAEAWADPTGGGELDDAVAATEVCLRTLRTRAGLEASGLLAEARGDTSLRLRHAWTELFSLWSDLAWDPWLAREAAADPARRGVHLVGFPPALAALSRIVASPSGPRALRFETYVDAREIANGYDELRDASEQRARFELVGRLRAAAELSPLTQPRAFLADLEDPGLPPCVGVALGLERVIALALGLVGIQDLSFP